jgi:hypothetical protein
MGKSTEISHILSMKNLWKKQQKTHEKNNEKCVKKYNKKFMKKQQIMHEKGVLNGCRF